jgi:Pro-kumamolisin, activation domain
MPARRARRSVANTERPRLPEARLVGPTGLGEAAQVTVSIRRQAGAPPLPDHEDWVRTPPGQRVFLTPEQFTARYGATQQDLDAVTTFASEHGLRVVEANAGRRSVVLSGTVAQMNDAFGVTLNDYQVPGQGEPSLFTGRRGLVPAQTHRGYEGAVRLPSSVADIVEDVIGLDNRRTGGGNQTWTSDDPVGISPLAVPQVISTYDFPTNSAANQTIGIVSMEGGYDQDDVNTYFSSFQGALTGPTIVSRSVNGGANRGQGDPETLQDILISSSVAQHATIVVYFITFTGLGDAQAWVNLLNRLIIPDAGETAPPVMSSSFFVAQSDDGSMVTTADLSAISGKFKEVASRGITFFIASGDSGSDSGVGDGSVHVQYPGSDPWVTSCGGTALGTDGSGNLDETVWNDSFPDPFAPGIYYGATGGGVSDFFALPPWQSSAGVPASFNDNTVRRGVPDIAANASPLSGYPMSLTSNNMSTSFNGSGTSAAAPLYAGLTAVMIAALGQPIGFLNPTLYALGESVFRDITSGNNLWGSPENAATHYYTAGPGWDACTGWGVIDGNELLSALQLLFQRSMTFVMQRSTFGQDEVAATGGVFDQAFFVIVDGLTPSDFPAGGITTLSPSPAQLQEWAPAIPDPAGPAGATNITLTPSAVSSDDPSLSAEIQRFTFTYTVTFPDQSAFTSPPASDFPEILTLNATLQASTGTLMASTEIELVTTADPYFASESNGGLYWLSEDIRVFYAVEGSTLFGAPPLGNTPGAAQSFIQWIISHISGPNGTGPNGDTFEATLSLSEQSSAISLLPETLDAPPKNIYNFAIARVRLDGLSEKAPTVRAFFRLFQSQSVAVPYQAPLSPTGVSAPTGAYRQWSDGTADGQKIPLLGISADGSEYITVPCFATARVPNTSTSTNMTTQTDGPNVQPMTPVAGSTVYAYFGCWLDNNQSEAVFPLGPAASPDGPFTGQTLNTVSQVLNRGGHQCLIVEIVDDEAPILNNATPGADKIAQRNLAFTIVANPGLDDSRLATHTFEIRPSPFALTSDTRPDELMIDWGSLPEGTVASIYLPAVAAAEVLDLAARMYLVHDLTATDPHTLQCPAGGTTYIPVPPGSGPNYAGLFCVQLPPGVRRGEEFKIVARQITSSLGGRQDPAGVKEHAVKLPPIRFVYGSFQIAIPVSVKSEMLIPEERNLSVLRWIQQSIPAVSRWYLVFQRYIAQLEGRVTALGGDGGAVPPTQTGIWPGLTEPGSRLPSQPPRRHLASFTGKVDGIVYDRFGDFEAFVLEDFEGELHRFDSHENPVCQLVLQAWRHRILVTVTTHRGHRERPIEITLHGAPPPFQG